MLTRKEIEKRRELLVNFGEWWSMLGDDALAKHDALLEIYRLLGGEGEPEDVVEACKSQAKKVVGLRNLADEMRYLTR